MQKTLKARLLVLFLTVVMCVGFMTPAHAYEVVYIQTSIDPDQWEIVSGVIRSDVGVTRHSPEFRRIPESDLESLANAGNSPDEFNALINSLTEDDLKGGKEIANSIAQAGLLTNFGICEEKNRVLTFPTDQNRRDNSTPEDYEEAVKINNELVFGLNQAFNAYLEENNISKTNNALDYKNTMMAFLASCSVSGYNYKFTYLGKDVTVKWKMEKPDGQRISWGTIVYEAFYNYCLEGEEAVNVGNVYSDMNVNALSKAITGFFAWCLDSLRSALGLWSMDELVFNRGLRGVAYLGGIFPATWEATLWTLFSIFEIFGAALLLAGILISVVHKALSTTNVIERMHLMSKIQDLIVCAVILAILPFALRIILSLSSSLSQIAYDMLPKDAAGKTKEVNELVKRFTASNGSIGGIVGQFMYFGIQIYFNFYYAVRAFSVPVLIIMSPFFVCGICLSSSKKQLAVQWSKELLSMIFMQSIHAFCLGLVLILPASGHSFDNIIMLYAIIPLSQTLKTLIFGQTSGFAERTAEKAKSTATRTLALAGMGALSAGVKGGAAVLGGRTGGDAGGGADGNSPSNSTSSDPSGGSDSGSASPIGGGAPMGDASGTLGGLVHKAGNIARKVKSLPSKAGHAITNTRIGQAIKNNPGIMNAKIRNPKEFALGAAKSLVLNPAYKIAKTGAKMAGAGVQIAKNSPRIAAGMALGAAGGMVSAVGGRDLGRMMMNGGGAIIAGRKLNQDAPPENQDPASNSSSSSDSPDDPFNNPNQSGPNAEDAVGPINLNAGGTRDADEVVNDTVMEPRNFNQQDLNQMGISNVSYERGSLRFASGGDSPQAQELRAYAQYLDTLSPAEKRAEIENRGISATQDGDLTRVRVNAKDWAQANGGASINGYTNKKGDSSISVSSPKNGAPPSFTGGQIMNVDPTQIQGYQQTTRTVTNDDGTTRQESVGSVPIQNTTAVQRAILSSGQGVTRDQNNIYVPLTQNGQPEKYVQKVSFAAREKHMQQQSELNTRFQSQSGQPQNGSDTTQPPIQNGSTQTEPPRSPTEGMRPQPTETGSGPVEPPMAEPHIEQSQPSEAGSSSSQIHPPEVAEPQPRQDEHAQPSPEPQQPQADDPIPYPSFVPEETDIFSYEGEPPGIGQDGLDPSLTDELNNTPDF